MDEQNEMLDTNLSLEEMEQLGADALANAVRAVLRPEESDQECALHQNHQSHLNDIT